ncbi:MAG: sn-glycerol-1-phosphate dehydrogenase [Treponema sp.]|jgi:glycerol-1-phosphate dehydrogenase [NAD(P)+]|nr:sn-glycerol-1-phosphate dehydrogenase [Treponema sp.]
MEQKVPVSECLAAAKETRAMNVGTNALEALPELLGRHFSPGPVFIVADENTFGAAGKAVTDALDGLDGAGIPRAGSFMFGRERIHAEYRHVETLKEQFRTAGENFIPLVIGSGTLNDLVKRAAFECKLPYLCVATAASVDGFTANGASIVYEEFKQTMPCDAPRVLVADSAILAAAPRYLSSSGFGDLAGKLIGGSDWIIAATAFGFDGKGLMAPGSEAIDPAGWAMVQNGLMDTLEASLPAVRGDSAAVTFLFEALAVTGFAIQYYQDSRPSSGCEHMFSHIWEMENLSVNGIPVTHGHKVAMGTLAAAAFTECFFSGSEPPAPASSYARPSLREREEEVRKAFAGQDKAAEAALKAAGSKYLPEAPARLLAGALRDCWKEVKEKCLAHLPSYEKFRSLFAEAQCPVRPEEIGLTRRRVIAAAAKAQMIRRRYTVLDYAWDLGVFDQVLKRMEDSSQYLW